MKREPRDVLIRISHQDGRVTLRCRGCGATAELTQVEACSELVKREERFAARHGFCEI